MSNASCFKALYTKHKTQKSKKWMDGFVRVAGNRAVLFDENRKEIDSVFLTQNSSAIGVGKTYFLAEKLNCSLFTHELDNVAASSQNKPSQHLPTPRVDIIRGKFNLPFRSPTMGKPPPPAPDVAAFDESLDESPQRVPLIPESVPLLENVTPAKSGGRSNAEILALLAQRASSLAPVEHYSLPSASPLPALPSSTPPPKSPAAAMSEVIAAAKLSEGSGSNLSSTIPILRGTKKRPSDEEASIFAVAPASSSSLSHSTSFAVVRPALKPKASAAATPSSASLVPSVINRAFQPPLQIIPAWKKITAWDHNQLCFPDQETINTVAQLEAGGSKRQILIPDRFDSLADYQRIMRNAIHEDLNLRLLQIATSLRRTLATISQHHNRAGGGQGGLPGKTCTHGIAAKFGVVRKEGNNKGRPYYSCANRTDQCKFFEWADAPSPNSASSPAATLIASVESISKAEEPLFRSNSVPLYVDAKIVIGGEPLAGKFNRQAREARARTVVKFTFLQIENREHSSAYAKDDIWIISTNPNFLIKSADDYLFLAHSIYHGPTRFGMIQIKPFNPAIRIPDGTRVYAIRGPNASSELGMLDCLDKLSYRSTPLVPFLLKGRSSTSTPHQRNALSVNQSHSLSAKFPTGEVSMERLREIATETIGQYRLNEDQAAVLSSVLKWWLDDEGDVSPGLLVHGVFGSGKSHLLVILVIFLTKILDEIGDQETKILIAAATNTAVDRVLLGLLELGYTEFLRVGSLRKIAKPVLSHMLDTSTHTERIKELRRMLKSEELSDVERLYVKVELDNQKAGRHKEREGNLKTIRTVGVTCAASTFPIMKESKFKIVFLDECSQMVEASSLLPMAFGCSRLLCVGDPLQLPPTLSNYIESSTPTDLGRTLFSRLSQLGVIPIMLRTQYRCHPSFSGVVNRLFYSNRLLNGVTEEQRPSLVEGMPPLIFCNADQGKEEAQRMTSSYSNEFEAQVVVHLIKLLIDEGVLPSRIGVIALYRAQVTKVAELLAKAFPPPKPKKRSVAKGSKKIVREALEDEAEEGVEGDEADEEEEEEEAEGEEEEAEKAIEAIDSDVDVRDIQISTVDAFQGAEKDVIIVTCSRSTKFTGFIDSPKRLNVALTRAKNHLIIIGRQNVLCAAEGGTWKEITRAAQQLPTGIQQGSTILKLESLMDLPSSSASSSTPSEQPKRKVEEISTDDLEMYESLFDNSSTPPPQDVTNGNVILSVDKQSASSDLPLPLPPSLPRPSLPASLSSVKEKTEAKEGAEDEDGSRKKEVEQEFDPDVAIPSFDVMVEP